MKYHINPETGNANQCKALKARCKFSTEDTELEHYATKEEARASYEKSMDQNTFAKTVKVEEEITEDNIGDLFNQAMRKRVDVDAIEARIAYTKAKNKELEDNFIKANYKINNVYSAIENNDKILEEYNNDYKVMENISSDEEREAVRDYTGISYTPINEYLYDEKNYEKRLFRLDSDGVKKVKKSLDEQIKLLDSFIAKAESKDRTLYRVLDQDTTKDFVSSEEFALSKGYEEGATVSMKGYSSTSIDPAQVTHRAHWGEHSVVAFVIKAKSGAPVDYTVLNRSHSQNLQDREREILLPRDIEFRVEKVERSSFEDKEHGESYSPLTVYLEEV